MRHLFKTAAVVMGVVAMSATAQAEIKPAVVYDLGGKFDKSFNDNSNASHSAETSTGIAS